MTNVRTATGIAIVTLDDLPRLPDTLISRVPGGEIKIALRHIYLDQTLLLSRGLSNFF